MAAMKNYRRPTPERKKAVVEVGICHLCGKPVYADEEGNLTVAFHEILRDWFYHDRCFRKNNCQYHKIKND